MLWAFKSPIRGVGAPTPNFDPYASSYNHIFIQNTRKLHFLCQARLVGYEYVEENVDKILQHFLKEKNTHFFGVGAPMPLFGLLKAQSILNQKKFQNFLLKTTIH